MNKTNTLQKIKLLLIEDNRLLKNGILKILKPHKDIVIIAGSENGASSLLKIKQLKPTVILLDLGLSSQNSLEVVEMVKKEFPLSRIIVMDLAPLQTDILQFVKAGANGFILKDVAEGSTVLPQTLVNSLFSQIVEHSVGKSKSKLKEIVCMTKREQEVIGLLSTGMTNKEIGHKIQVSTFTVKSHIHNIMEKLALHTRLEIANYTYTGEGLNQITKSISLVNN